MPRHSILFLHSSDEEFGSDRVLLSMVEAALANGALVSVLLPDDTGPGWLSAQLGQRTVPVAKVPLAPARRRYLRPRSYFSYLRSLGQAHRAIRDEVMRRAPDVIHVNTSALIAAALIRRNAERRVFWHVHEVVTSPRRLAWLFRLLPMWSADDVIATSDATAASLRNAWCKRARLHRIYNGIPTREPEVSRRQSHQITCVFAGRLQRRKGYDLFIEAAAEVTAEFPNARFAVAGTPVPGEEWRTEALRARVEELGLQGSVDLLGLCHDVPALLDGADIVVVPSREPEAFGLVTVEAMRSGCAVIATSGGATPEIVADGVSGILVPAGDQRALVGALGQLMGDKAWRERLGAAARSRARDFSEQRFQAEIVNLWSVCPK